ncbi:hypothetical protein LOTGIDRAFT_236452 [Lottia gigantea]|uniref:VWFC domain-containing protein n=1 Tax=Lottia gigantea TaxID=225164 RepID=V3Z010_LOTGI|nr:hypothetical protein LOTGIDRAFT_236452 [Lottia gigantea]ESO83808.1 hypothetical protein LOTGIDRAFT_236452 [Lottia gigantea]
MFDLTCLVLILGSLAVVADAGTWGAPLRMSLDANGVPEYYCKAGDNYLNIGESLRTTDCFDCNCSFRYGLNCVSIGSALHKTGRMQGCRFVELPNCCYKFASITNPNEDCIPETCPN